MSKCTAIIKSGKRKGQVCGRNAIAGVGVCGPHWRQAPPECLHPSARKEVAE